MHAVDFFIRIILFLLLTSSKVFPHYDLHAAGLKASQEI